MICFENGSLIYIPDFLPSEEADSLFYYLIHNIPWMEKKIKIFGKWVQQPRLVFWFGDKVYRYSGISLETREWDEKIFELKKRIESFFSFEWNHSLLNFYRNGRDSMGWHADDEKELGKNPIIASYSLGVSRKILFCRKKMPKRNENIASIILSHNSLFFMLGEIQHYWYHAVPKEKNIQKIKFSHKNQTWETESRINITFRKII
ncbi:MAG: alpha-ketoglutarate-dependent dioxygenase AlkB [Leptospiraceae bacterium]|nr:alpha-ketoglutarate-dependent dioxygenase AlkB [Leptospiraceae bacterium]MDW7976105.1 alpha-ketoglutarate-dependent dioxygenase AlkB [Leptospiraceae bacterium]